MDLFELTERIFQGVVYFLYNLVFSIWTVFRHPVRGPAMLQAHYESDGKRQMGGMTLLFLTQFILLLLILPFLTGSGTLGPLGAWLVTSELRWGDFWPALLSSVVAAVLVDAGLRLLMRPFYETPSAERERAIGQIEYAMATATTLLSLGLWLVFAFGRPPDTPVAIAVTVLAVLAGTGAVVLAAAFVMAAGIAASGKSNRLHRDRPLEQPASRSVLVAASLVFAGLLALLSSTFGMGAGAALQALRDDSDYSASQLRLLHLTCTRRGDAITVEGAVWNGSGAPAVLRPEGFELVRGARVEDPDDFGKREAMTSRLTALRPDTLPTVAAPKSVQALGPWQSGSIPALPQGESCLLVGQNPVGGEAIAPVRPAAEAGAAEGNAM